MRAGPPRLRLVSCAPAPRDDGPGLARARATGELDARLGRLLLEIGRLADETQDDAEIFALLGSAAQAIGVAQRHVRKRRSQV